MKKFLLVTLFAFALGLSFVDANAGRGHYNRNCGSCNTCPQKSCKADCVVEEPCPVPPCCLTAVEVPAEKITYISYGWRCPVGCRRTEMSSSFSDEQ